MRQRSQNLWASWSIPQFLAFNWTPIRPNHEGAESSSVHGLWNRPPPAGPAASHTLRHPAKTACPIIPLTSARKSIWEILYVNSDLFSTDINAFSLEPNFFYLPSFPFSLYTYTIYTFALMCELICMSTWLSLRGRQNISQELESHHPCSRSYISRAGRRQPKLINCGNWWCRCHYHKENESQTMFPVDLWHTDCRYTHLYLFFQITTKEHRNEGVKVQNNCVPY